MLALLRRLVLKDHDKVHGEFLLRAPLTRHLHDGAGLVRHRSPDAFGQNEHNPRVIKSSAPHAVRITGVRKRVSITGAEFGVEWRPEA